MPFYTGVGSRETPSNILILMTRIAKELVKGHYILRSGGASGADSAFENGVSDEQLKNIYLPRKGFNYNKSNRYNPPPKEAEDIARSVHPYFDKCGDFARAAHSRNVLQILGDNLKEPSHFVVCWTPDGAEFTKECHSIELTGGTRTAIAVADIYKVPVFNLARPDALIRLQAFVKQEIVPARVEWHANPDYIKHVLAEKRKKKSETKKKSFNTLPSP